MSVSVVGLGLMGSALARAFLSKGFKTFVWNRSAEKAAPLNRQGAILAGSAAECVNGGTLVVVCLTNFDAFSAALTSEPLVVERGRHILVNFTTGSPLQIRQSCALAKSLGFAAYMHGAIMAFPQHIGLPETLLFYSGDWSAYASVKDTVAALGSPMYLDDDETSAATQETILTGAAYGSWMGFLQSVALLKTTKSFKSGAVTAQSFVADTIEPLLLNSLKTYHTMAHEIDEQRYQDKGNGARLSQHLAALRTFGQTYQETGLSTEYLSPMIHLIEKAIARGGADDELSSLVEVIPVSTSSVVASKPRAV